MKHHARHIPFFALAAGAMLSLSVRAATNTEWIDDPDNRGTESAPINIYNAAKWTSGDLPSSSWNLNFTAGGLTYITNSTTKQIAMALRFGGGDFVVFGPMKYNSFGYNFSETAPVSIDKRGDWTNSTYFYTATAAGSSFVITNRMGNLAIGKGGATRFGSGDNSVSSFVLEDGAVTSSSSSYNLSLGYGTGSTGYFEQNGGTVSVAGKLYLGYGTGSTGHFEQNGGTVFAKILNIGYNGTGELTINNGTFSVAVQTSLGANGGSSTGYLNLNGGVFETPYICAPNTKTGGTILFNGGTLRVAPPADSLIQAVSRILVRIGERGGTIDTAGLNVNYGKATLPADGVTNDGGLSIVGGGTLTVTGAASANRFEYNGPTTIEVGTHVTMPSAKVGSGVTFTIPAGLGRGIYVPLALSENYSLESVFTAATFPNDPDARFELSQDKKRILCYYKIDGIQDPYWIGGATGDLGLGSNWSTGTVPQGGNCYIGSDDAAASLTSSASFRPDSITFMEGSKSVTINGTADITGITVVTNLSAVNHTINVPVRFADKIRVQQGAMAYSLRAEPHVIFQGGAYGTVIDGAYSRFISGHYFLSDDTGAWTATEYQDGVNFGLLEGSSISVPYLTNVSQIFVGGLTGNDSGPNGGALTTGVYRTSGRICRTNQGTGEFVVTNELYVTLTAANYLTYRYSDGWFKFEKVTIGKDSSTSTFYFANSANLQYSNGATFPAQYRKNIRVGAGGLGFEPGLTKSPSYQFGRHTNDPPVLAAWHDDFTIGTKGQAGNKDVTFFGITTTLDTTDEAGIGRTITIDALCAGSGGVNVTGTGTVVVNNRANTCSGAVTVSGTATLALNAGCPLGTGSVTNNATLKANSSGMVAFANSVVCKTDAALAFNFTERRTAPCLAFNSEATGNAMPATLNIRITATDRLRPAGGRHTLTTGYDFTNTEFTLVDPPEWVQSVGKDANGNIVLDVISNGTAVIIR